MRPATHLIVLKRFGLVRPATIVAVRHESGAIEVVVAPITHLEPRPPSQGIEIPPKVKHHLGLDDERSWVPRDRCRAAATRFLSFAVINNF